MNLNDYCKKAFEASQAKGFGVPGMTTDVAQILKVHMLMVSEIAEATEEVRNNKPAFYLKDENSGACTHISKEEVTADHIEELLKGTPGGKPEGQAVELADVAIRIFDWFGRNGWDLEAVVEAKMAYNATRGHRHGGKLA